MPILLAQTTFNLPTEIVAALIILIVLVIGIGQAIARYVTAVVDNRTAEIKQEQKDKEEKREEQRQERELNHQRELEELRQRTEDNKATNEQISKLVDAMLEMVKSREEDRRLYAQAFHAFEQGLTNNAQSIGDLVESIDKLAQEVSDGTNRSRAVLAAINELKNHLLSLESEGGD